MSTIWKHPKSSYWCAIFRDENGVWRKRSTKIKATRKNREKAEDVAREWQRACDTANQKRLTEATARKVLSGILERTTGETLRGDTVREFCDRWIKAKELSKHEGTATRYAGTVAKWLDFLGAKANHPIDGVTPYDCQKFNDHLLGQKLAPATLIVEIKTLRSIFNAARRQGLIETNPAEAVELPENVRQVRRKQFTSAQVQMLVDAAEDPEWRTVILLGYYAGLRLSDAVTLDWRSVDFVKQALVLDVRKTDDEGHTVPLHPVLETHLEKLAGDKGGPVCPTLANVPVSGRSGLSKQFLAIMRKAGIGNESVETGGQRELSRLSFHSLRVSFNSELYNRDVTQETRKKLTGHASDAVNDRYTRSELKTLRKAVRKLPRLKA